MDAPLIITKEVDAALHVLKEKAEQNIIDINEIVLLIKTTEGKQQHLNNMTAQTVMIPGPWNFFVTYSVEIGHPCGKCRHLSVSIERAGRVPSVYAVQLISKYLGFVGDLKSADAVYSEKMSDGGIAINIIQQFNIH